MQVQKLSENLFNCKCYLLTRANQTEVGKKTLQQRVVVEHRIARLVRLGIRQSRYFGKRKTCFQVIMAAVVANLTLVVAFCRRKLEPTTKTVPLAAAQVLESSSEASINAQFCFFVANWISRTRRAYRQCVLLLFRHRSWTIFSEFRRQVPVLQKYGFRTNF